MSTQLELKNFEEIYDRTYNSILKFVAIKCCDVEDINDILQNTYIELYRILSKKDLLDVVSEKSYIIGIAKNVIKRYFTLKYKYQLLSYSFEKEEDTIMQIRDNFNLEQDFINKDNAEQIWKYLRKKDLVILKIFYLYFSLDMKISEIANELNIKESSIKTKIYRTLKELKNTFGKGEDYNDK